MRAVGEEVGCVGNCLVALSGGSVKEQVARAG